uniref:Uncharacterized protein n=1 Tax=Oryza glumipatula TaxID=40148 RepID=A0A0E0B1L0_9ORYZ
MEDHGQPRVPPPLGLRKVTCRRWIPEPARLRGPEAAVIPPSVGQGFGSGSCKFLRAYFADGAETEEAGGHVGMSNFMACAPPCSPPVVAAACSSRERRRPSATSPVHCHTCTSLATPAALGTCRRQAGS